MTAAAQLPALLGGTWSVSDSRTRVRFSVGNLGRRAHGTVPCRWGEVRLDGSGHPVAVRAELELDGIDTGIARRDRDLRAPRFLDIDRQPTMTWSALRFSRTGDGAWAAEGELRVRGTSAPLTLVGRPEAVADDGSWVRVRATAVLDRTAVGIRAPAFLVGRTVEIDVDAWLTPTPVGPGEVPAPAAARGTMGA